MLRVRSDIIEKRWGQSQLGLIIELVGNGLKIGGSGQQLYIENVLDGMLRVRSNKIDNSWGRNQFGLVIEVIWCGIEKEKSRQKL